MSHAKITWFLVPSVAYYIVLYINMYCFYRANYASAVLGVVILSVRPSVRPSHACFVTNPKNLPAIFL